MQSSRGTPALPVGPGWRVWHRLPLTPAPLRLPHPQQEPTSLCTAACSTLSQPLHQASELLCISRALLTSRLFQEASPSPPQPASTEPPQLGHLYCMLSVCYKAVGSLRPDLHPSHLSVSRWHLAGIHK